MHRLNDWGHQSPLVGEALGGALRLPEVKAELWRSLAPAVLLTRFQGRRSALISKAV